MPLNTRVGRCVTKLRKKYGYGKAIGICQHSTKQNYLTGKTMRKKKTSRRKNRSRKKRGGRKKKKGGASKPDHIAIDIKDIEHGDARPPVEPQRVDADGIHVGSNVKVIDGDSPNLDDTGLVVAINNDELASIDVYLDHADEEESFIPDQLELIREGGMRPLPSLTIKTHMGTKYMMKVDDNNQPVLNQKGMIELYDYKMASAPPHRLLWKKSIPSYKNPQEGSGKKTRRRKKRGGTHVPTWLIKATPKPVADFTKKIFNNPKYVSVEDEEAREIMNYLTSEAKDNTDDNRYFIMKYEEGLWYPGEEISYDNAVNQCSNPCYQVDSTGIRHVLKRNVSHGSKRKTRKKKHKKRRKRSRRKKRR